MSKPMFPSGFSPTSVWSLKGKTFPSVSPAIFDLYPDLVDSPFWSGGIEDSFLAYCFSEDRSPVGVHLNGRFYGVALCRASLQKRLGPGDFWDLLEKFLNPMTGQQKNFLLALSTVLQRPSSEVVQVPNGDTVPVKIKELRSRKRDVPFVPQDGKVPDEPLCSLFSTIAKTLTYDCLLSRRVGSYASRYIRIFSDRWEISNLFPGLLLRMFISEGESNSERIYRIFSLLEGRDSLDQKLIVSKDKLEIFLSGSKMGEMSGLWIRHFARFLTDYGFSGQIYAYDPFEHSRRYSEGKFFVSHRKEMIDSKFPFPPSSVLVDDAQSGDQLMDYQALPRVFSLKKRGKMSFNYEKRYFSHTFPPFYKNRFSSCQCQRCRVCSYVANSLGGYGSFLRLQSDLSEFGPVCESGRIEKYRALLSGAAEKAIAGQPLNLRELKANSVLERYDVVKGKIVLGDSSLPLWVEDIVLDRRVGVFGAYDLMASVPHSCARPYEVIVVTDGLPLIEFGLIPEIVSNSVLDLPGFRLQKHDGDFFYYVREFKRVKKNVPKARAPAIRL